MQLKQCFSVFVKGKTCKQQNWILAEEISKQSFGKLAWFLWTAYSKMQEERDRFQQELLSIKEPELEDSYNPQYIHIGIKKRERGQPVCLSG